MIFFHVSKLQYCYLRLLTTLRTLIEGDSICIYPIITKELNVTQGQFEVEFSFPSPRLVVISKLKRSSITVLVTYIKGFISIVIYMWDW